MGDFVVVVVVFTHKLRFREETLPLLTEEDLIREGASWRENVENAQIFPFGAFVWLSFIIYATEVPFFKLRI